MEKTEWKLELELVNKLYFDSKCLLYQLKISHFLTITLLLLNR